MAAPQNNPPLPAGAVPVPGGGTQQTISQMIASAANTAGIPVDLATRLVKQESSFNPKATSPVGAQGLTQLMPGTAKDMGVSDPFDPAQNLAGGFKYLASLKSQFGSWDHALAAYNWGPGNVSDWLKNGGDASKLPDETRNYVRTIAPDSPLAAAGVKKKSRLDLLGRHVELGGAPPLPAGAVPLEPPKAAGPPLPQGAIPVPGTATPPPGAAPTPQGPAASPTPLMDAVRAHPSMVQQGFTNLLSTMEKNGMHAQAHALRVLADNTVNPLQLMNAVLGAPQRFIAGALGEDLKESQANPKQVIGNPIREIGAGLHGIASPNDPSLQENAQKALGFDKLRDLYAKGFNGQKWYDAIPSPISPQAEQNIRKSVGDFVFQQGTDPLTYTPAVLEKMGVAALGKLGQVGDAALKGDLGGFAQKVVKNAVPDPEARLAFNDRGQSALRGIRNSENAAKQHQAVADAELIKAHKAEIEAGTVPPAVEQRLLRDAYVYGDAGMRKEALAHGYKPTEEEAAKAPEGILNYHLKDEYFPHLGQHAVPQQMRVAGREYKVNAPGAGFEKPQISDELPKDRVAAMEARLGAGRAAIAHRMMQKRLAQETGMGAPEFGIKENPTLQGLHVTDPELAKNLIEDPRGASGKKMEGLPGLQDISNIGRDTLVGAQPVPHSKNITTLAYLAGGVPGVLKGMHYALSGVPQDIAKRLEASGAASHFMESAPTSISPVKYLPWRKASAGVLDRIDSGMRAARLEQLDKQYGNTLTDFQKAKLVNEDIGDYYSSPAYVHIAKMIGAQFPQWHNFIVPTAVGRGILKAPQRVQSLIRAENIGNQDMLGNQPYEMDMGGPVSEFGSYTDAPIQALDGQWVKSILSPSTIGPVGSDLAHGDSQPQTFNALGGIGAAAGNALIPYFSIIAPQFGYNPYGSKAPPTARSIAAFFAANPRAKESAFEMRRRDLMEKQGLSGFKAQQQAVKEMRQLDRLIH